MKLSQVNLDKTLAVLCILYVEGRIWEVRKENRALFREAVGI